MKKNLPAIKTNIVALTESDIIPPELMRQLEEKVPAWIKEMEADGTAVMRWNLEHFIIIEQILQDKFGFPEKDLVKLEKEIKKILPHVAKFKAEEPRLLKREDYYIIKQMIKRNKQLYKAERKAQLPAGETKALGRGKK